MYKVVLTEKAAQDYMEELWAEKAVAEYNKNKSQKLYGLEEVRRKLKQKNARVPAGKR